MSANLMVQHLQQAKGALKLSEALMKLDKYSVLVLDDIGYVQKSSEETSVLFELIAHRYERYSLIITSNQSFEEWDQLFDNTVMTVAAIDRLIHHAKILQCEGESYRRKEAQLPSVFIQQLVAIFLEFFLNLMTFYQTVCFTIPE